MIWSWTCLSLAIGAQTVGIDLLVTTFRIMAGLGPLLTAIVMLRAASSDERASYVMRLKTLKGIGPVWLLVIVATAPGLTLLAISLDLSIGGCGGMIEKAASEYLMSPWGFIGFIMLVLLFGPMPEELGWRGYGVWKAQEHHPPISTGVIIGFAWMLWHVPLFFIDGTYQEGLGLGSLLFYDYFVMMFSQSVIMVWIYNNTAGSIPAAIIFHFMVNFTGELLFLSITGDVLLTCLWSAMALIVAVRYGCGNIRSRSSGMKVNPY
ncbi:MAG: CPBP family intramembrane metalloprotease [Methanomassiliicoccales archaeon]|nr:MAG: CPBP family intramembrane metalloprotease [Methanomassiliicoccales archaeon]